MRRLFVIRAAKRALQLSIVFVVFGFVDNLFMILFGSAFDAMLLKMLGAGMTMLAAGLGNTVSDAIGISLGRVIEKWAHVAWPTVENDKDILPTWAVIFAETLGIIVGCLLGLFPLLFL